MIIKYYIAILFYLTSCVFSGSLHQSYGFVKMVLFSIGATIPLIYIVLKNGRKRLWAFTLIMFIVISSLLSADPWLAFWGQFNRANGSIVIILFVLIASYIQVKPKDIPLFENVFCLIGISFALYSFAQVLDTPYIKHIYPTNSLAGNSNNAGNVMAICLPFMMRRFRFAWLILPVAIVLTNCRGAMIAGSIAILLCFINNKKVLMMIMLSVLIGVIALRSMPDNNRLTNIAHFEKTGRFQVWKESLPLVSFIGTGSGQYREAYGKIKSKGYEKRDPGILYNTPHNIYLNHLIVFGVVPTIIWIGLIIIALEDRRKTVRLSMLCYCVAGISSFETMETLPLFWLLITLSLIEYRPDYRNRQVIDGF